MVEVARTSERCIFLIENNNLKYYIVIPMVNKNVKIVLGIIENVNNDSIKNIPNLSNEVVVVPVFNQGVINYLKEEQQSYTQAFNYFSSLINNSYGLLIHNKKEVDPTIMINNSADFSNFINSFVSKFSERVQKSDRDLLSSQNNYSYNNQDNSQNLVNNDIPVSMNAYPNVDVSAETEVSKPMTKTLSRDNRGEPGFVSYVLLGVVIAVMSLIFLYMLI